LQGLSQKGAGDQALLSAVARASADLLSQPSGFQPVLNAAVAAQVAAELGFGVPAARKRCEAHAIVEYADVVWRSGNA